MVALPGKSRQGAGFRATLFLFLLAAAAARAHAPELDPVDLALREFEIRYPLDAPQRRHFIPDVSDDGPPDHELTSEEVEAYAAWLDMLARRASRAAADRPERNWAGHAREELRKGRTWHAIGQEEERHRGIRPPRRHPISIGKKIEPARIDRDPRHVSAYRKALAHMHRGARYALAVMKARGLDPEREPVEEEQMDPKRAKLRKRDHLQDLRR